MKYVDLILLIAVTLIAISSTTFAGPVAGDFNGNGERDTADIDLLTDQMLSRQPDLVYDLDGDGSVNIRDRSIWVENLSNTFFGDSNFDGKFNSGDFVHVWQAAKYEKGLSATWEEGDWNGDKVFNSSDFCSAFGCGGYERSQRDGGLQVVPEPTTSALWLTNLLMTPGLRRIAFPRRRSASPDKRAA